MDAEPDTNEGAILDRLYDAIARGDIAGAKGCCTADAVFWYCFDGARGDLDSAARSWTGLNRTFEEIRLQDVRRTRTDDGRVVSRHMFVGRRAGGETIAWAICMFVETRDGLIARIDEYIDRGGSFPVTSSSMATPGL